jgi:hypothetical protein
MQQLPVTCQDDDRTTAPGRQHQGDQLQIIALHFADHLRPCSVAAAAAAAAADYLKCPHALAWTITNLAFSAMEFREGYTASGNW